MYLDEENYRIARKEYKDFINTYHENVSFNYFIDCIYTPTEEIAYRKEMRKHKKDESSNTNEEYSYRGFFDSICVVDSPESNRLASDALFKIL